MNIQNSNSFNNYSSRPFSFKGTMADGDMIDIHTHIGKYADNPNITINSLGDLVKDTFEINSNGKIQQNEVKKVLVSTLECLDNVNGKPRVGELQGNQDLIDSCKNFSKLKPLVVCQPESGSAENIEKLLNNNPDQIYGFKLHPVLLGGDEKYIPYMKLAEKYNMPCVFHSDKVGSSGDPNLIHELAKKTPKVPVVLYHMSLAPAGQVGSLPAAEIERRGLLGQEDKYIWDVRESWNNEGIEVVSKALKAKDANLYLDVSWVKPTTVVHAIKEVGEDRVLFATDGPLGGFCKKEFYAQNVADIKSAIVKEFGEDRSKEIIDKVFYKNAQEIFFDKNWAKNIEESAVKSISKTKAAAISALLLSLIGAGVCIVKNTIQKKE